MLTCETYLGMFRELVDLHFGNGPYNWTSSNVPIWVEHNIQLAENVTQEEDRYSREYVPELGRVGFRVIQCRPILFMRCYVLRH